MYFVINILLIRTGSRRPTGFEKTRTRTRKNPHPWLWVRVFTVQVQVAQKKPGVAHDNPYEPEPKPV